MEEEFDFNPAPLLKKIDSIVDRFDVLFDKMESDKGGGSLKETAESSTMSFKKLLVVAGLLGGAFLALRGAFGSLPIVKDTLFSLGEIIKFNILAPIMQDLAPALNSILSWAIENRDVFVRIGATISNVFSVGIEIAKGFFGIISQLFGGLIDSFTSTFGITATGIGDTLRLLATKIVAGVGLFQLALESVTEYVVIGFKKIFESVKFVLDLFKEYLPIVGNISSILGDIVLYLAPVAAGLSAYFGTVKAISLATKGWAIAQSMVVTATNLNLVAMARMAAQAAVIKTITLLTKGWAAVQAALNVVMSLNPIGVVVAAVVAIGVGLVVLYNRSEKFRRALDAIGRAGKTALGWISNTVSSIGDFFSDLGSLATEGADVFMEALGQIGKWFDENVVQPIENGISFLKNKFKEFFGLVDETNSKVDEFNVKSSIESGEFEGVKRKAATSAVDILSSRVRKASMAPKGYSSAEKKINVDMNINMNTNQNINGENAREAAERYSKEVAKRVPEELNRAMSRELENEGI